MAQGFPTTFGYSSIVNIEEVGTIEGASVGRALTMRGSALPFMGAEWGFENVLVTTWYPGNAAEATQQLLGPRELPSTWEGEWKRTLLGRHPVLYRDEGGNIQHLVEPHLVREVLEDMGRKGQRLRVTWSVQGNTLVGSSSDPGRTLHNEDVKIVREGRIKSFKTPIDRHTDIRWTVEFAWLGRGGRAQKALSAREDTDASTIANGITSAIGKMSEAVSDAKLKRSKFRVPRSANKFTLGQLEQLAALPNTVVNRTLRQLQAIESQFKQAGDVALRSARQPAAILQSVSNFAANTRAIANNMVDAFGRVPMELKSSKRRAASQLRATGFFDGVEIAAALAARRAQEVIDKIQLPITTGSNQGAVRSNSGTQAARPGDLIAVYVTKDGDTPASVAVKFYGTPDRAGDLLSANKLPVYTPSFRRGQILAVPSAEAISRRKSSGR